MLPVRCEDHALCAPFKAHTLLGRVLELLLLLDSHWAFKKFSHPLVFLSPVSYPSVEFAKSQLEWMSDTVMKSFDQRRENPFLLKCVRMMQLFPTLSEFLFRRFVRRSQRGRSGTCTYATLWRRSTHFQIQRWCWQPRKP